jgi:hypothetical protein
MRSLALAILVTFSLALFGCPDKNAGPDPAASAKTTTATSAAKPVGSAGAAGSAKGGW